MSTAHDEIDLIHKAEEAARKRIEKAEKKALKIKEEADTEAKEVLDDAEHSASSEATRLISTIETRKVEINSSVTKDAEQTIKKYKASAKKKRDEAYKSIVKMLLGEV